MNTNTGAFRDLASPGARSYVGTIPRDKGTTGGVSPDQQVLRFFGRSEFEPPLNPYHGRAVVDQTLGDQFGAPRYELNVGLQIRNLIRADAEQPWFTIILPLIQSDQLTITGTIWRYNRRLPTPTPYHAPSPYVTEEFEQFYGKLQRYGESIRMESDYFHTDEGQQNFFLKLTGIASDMVEGIRFDVMRELLRAIDQNKRYYANHTYTEDPKKDIMMRVELTFGMNKVASNTDVNKLGIMMEKLERVLNEYVAGPYEMIVPPEWGIWLNKVAQTPVPRPYYLQGDDGGQLFIRNGPTPRGNIGRNSFWEYQDVTIETGSIPLRVLQRPVSFAEYYRASHMNSDTDLQSRLTGLLASEKDVSRMRNIFTYSLTEDRYKETKIQEMIAASNIVPESYDPKNPGSRAYRSLVDEYSSMGSSARVKFYPDENEPDPGMVNYAGKREAPIFLAWEPKGSSTGEYFIRIKYGGEMDENVTAAQDHNNEGQVLCAHLIKSYGMDRIGAHYSNAYALRRKLQQGQDNVAYWRAFVAANVFYSLGDVTETGGRFDGSRLADASDYTRYSNRWGVNIADRMRELAPQPAGHYAIPNKTPFSGFSSLTVPPGCDCPVGIRSIAEIQPDAGWGNLPEQVREHENALLNMVEMAQKLPESELVNGLNRSPWVHNPDLGSFAVAYTNGVSQFRAPLFLSLFTSYEYATAGEVTSNFDVTLNSDIKSLINELYTRDPVYRASAGAPAVTGSLRPLVDPVTGSLGADEDEPIEVDGQEPEETILQGILRDWFTNVQSNRDDVDTVFEGAPNNDPDQYPGYVYTVTYYVDPQPDGTFGGSYIRSAYISFELLNTNNDDLADAVAKIAQASLEAPRAPVRGGSNVNSHITYIASAGELAVANQLTVSEESVGTNGARAGATYRASSSVEFTTSPIDVAVTGTLSDSQFEEKESVDRAVEEIAEALEDYSRPSGPLGPTGASTGTISAPILSEDPGLKLRGDGAASIPVRCALVMTPGMLRSKTYLINGGPVMVGNKDTGYTTPISNNVAGSGEDRGGLGRLGRSVLVHGTTDIMHKMDGASYYEWKTSEPRHHTHFSFNQVQARMAGMDDDGSFHEASAEKHGYYMDGDEDSEMYGQGRNSRIQRRISAAQSHGAGVGRMGSLFGRRISTRAGRQSKRHTLRARGGGRRGRRRRDADYYEEDDYDDLSDEEGTGYKDLEESASRIGAREAHSYYEGARRKGRSRFGRRPFAHPLHPSGTRFSEGHGHDFRADIFVPGSDSKLRSGYRMVKRFNGSNFVSKMNQVTRDPTSPCTFFTIAAMMSRRDKIEHWLKLADNKLHITADFLLHRFVEVYAESALLLKAGLGFTVVNNSDYKNGEVTATKTYHGHLTVHYGAFVTRPDYLIMLEDMRLTGYIGGKGSGMVKNKSQLETGGARRGTARPSFITYALPIAQKELPSMLSPQGRFVMDDVLPQNMPTQGALFGGVDWYNRLWDWESTYNSERNSRQYFRTKGYTFPQVSFQGWQAIYDLVEGIFKVYSRGMGHMAGGDYPGAARVVDGHEPYFVYPGDPNLF